MIVNLTVTGGAPEADADAEPDADASPLAAPPGGAASLGAAAARSGALALPLALGSCGSSLLDENWRLSLVISEGLVSPSPIVGAAPGC